MSIKSKLQALRSGVSFFGLVVAFSSQYYPAHAGAGTITVKDAAGATQTFDVVTDGSGNFVQKSVTCDQSAAANCASVDASHNLGVVVGEALPGGTATLGSINSIISSLPGGTATLGTVNAILSGGTATLGSINAIVSALPGGTATLGTVNALLGVGSGLDGWNVTDGTKADAVCVTSTGTCSIVSLVKFSNVQTGSILAAVTAAIPSGGNTIGAVTPGVIASWGLTPAITPSSAPTNALLGGVVYNSTQPTLSTGQSIALQSDASGNLRAAVFGAPNVVQTDCSATIATNGTAVTLIAASATLHGFRAMNIDATTGSGEPVWISFTGTAGSASLASYPLAAPTATTYAGAGSYSAEFASGTNGNISAVAGTAGHKISCTKW